MATDSDEGSFHESDPKPGPHDLFINVLGVSFEITAGEDPEYLNSVLDQYKLAVASTQGIWGMKDPLKVAILTGFLLCDEANKLKLQFEEDQAAVEKALNRTANLILRLDKVVEESAHSTDGHG
ncbi:MAG: cell division protein ZapA [Treponema sp.]|nr:cell division protein ZapA [Treponema sp.]